MSKSDPIAKCARCGYPLTGINAERCPECGAGVTSGVPIATHRHRFLGQRRDYTLFADRINVRIRTLFGNQSEITIPLAQLDPQTWTGRVWPAALKPALTLFGVGGGFFVFVIVARVTDVMWGGFIWTSGAAGLAGLIAATLHARRIEYAFFRAVGRMEVTLLAIERAGPDAARFDDFIQTVRRQIAISK